MSKPTECHPWAYFSTHHSSLITHHSSLITYHSSLDCHALGEIARLIHVAASQEGDVIGQKLQRHDGDQGLQVIRHFRYKDDLVGTLRHVAGGFRVSLAGDGDHRAAACLDFLQVAHHLVEDAAL